MPQQPMQPGGEDPAVLKITMAAMKVLYDKKTSPAIVQILRSGQPAQSLMQAAVMLMKILFNASKGTMPVQAAVSASARIVSLLAELAQAAGVKVDPRVVQQVQAGVAQTLQQKMSQPQAQQPPTGAQPAAPPGMPMAAPQPGLVSQAMQGA